MARFHHLVDHPLPSCKMLIKAFGSSALCSTFGCWNRWSSHMRVSDFEELINKARLLVILRPCLSLSVKYLTNIQSHLTWCKLNKGVPFIFLSFQLNHEGFNKGNARRDGVL